MFLVARSEKTAELMRKIQAAKSVTRMLKVTGTESALPSVGKHLEELLQERSLRKEEFFALSGVSVVYGYEIIRGVKSPSRDTLIQFAFALELDVDGTNKLLRIGEKAQLYPLIKRDKFIIYAISHGLDIIKLNLLAEENGFLPIGKY